MKTSPSPAKTRFTRLLHVLCATVVPAFFGHQVVAGPVRPRPERVPPPATPPDANRNRPYLLVYLPPPLRFASSPPPYDRPTVATGPLHPGGLPEDIAAVNRDSTVPVQPEPPKADPLPPSPVATPTAPSVPTPPIILPDDTPTVIRAEDVLPFFRMPRTTSDNIIPPRSSATLRTQ